MARPVALHSTMSWACIWTRRPSRLSAAATSLCSPSLRAAPRDLEARSAAKVSIVVRPKLRPALSAVSTRTSNQVSIERDTNWYETT